LSTSERTIQGLTSRWEMTTFQRNQKTGRARFEPNKLEWCKVSNGNT